MPGTPARGGGRVIRRVAVLAGMLLLALPARAEIPEVEAAAANLWVHRPPARGEEPALTLKDRRGREKPAQNKSAGVPGMNVTVQFPPESAELDEAQKLALYKLTREWRATRGVRLLWLRAAGDAPLARKRAEALRRATGGKGFPWDKVYLDLAPVDCAGDACQQGTITVIEAR